MFSRSKVTLKKVTPSPPHYTPSDIGLAYSNTLCITDLKLDVAEEGLIGGLMTMTY